MSPIFKQLNHFPFDRSCGLGFITITITIIPIITQLESDTRALRIKGLFKVSVDFLVFFWNYLFPCAGGTITPIGRHAYAHGCSSYSIHVCLCTNLAYKRPPSRILNAK